MQAISEFSGQCPRVSLSSRIKLASISLSLRQSTHAVEKEGSKDAPDDSFTSTGSPGPTFVHGNKSFSRDGVVILTIEAPLDADDIKAISQSPRYSTAAGVSETQNICKVRVKFTLDFQLEVSWDEYGSLKAGTCNLYSFPHIEWRSKKASVAVLEPVERSPSKKARTPSSKLATILLQTSIQHPEVFLRLTDSLGAGVVHALLLARSDEADDLVVSLCDATPQLLCGTYTKGDFDGEDLVAVTDKEALMKKLLTIALEKLPRDDLEVVFSQTAKGPFFLKEPMSHFGGTPVSYMAVFGMLDAIKSLDAIIPVRNFALNVRCPVSGYLPIHAAVIASRKDIYDYLCDHCGCDEFARVSKSAVFDLEGLTPLQLAAKYGIHTIFKHLLRRRAVKEWTWGPVTSYMLPMRGIDTEGIAGTQQVMELVSEVVASQDAQMMLESSFMNGFIYELFVKKWRRWAMYLWSALTALDVGFMLMLSLLASPTILGGNAEDFTHSRGPAAVTMTFALFNCEEQIREALTFWHAYGEHIDTWVEVKLTLWQWVGLRSKNWILVVTSLVACFELLTSEDMGVTMQANHIRILFAISALFAWLQFFSSIFSPFERFSVFVVMIEKMVRRDMSLWLAIALPLTFAFTTATNAVSFNAATFEVPDQEPTSWYESLENLALLALIGLDPLIKIHLPENYTEDDEETVASRRRLKTTGKTGDFAGSVDLVGGFRTTSYPSSYAGESILGVFFFMFYTGFMFIVVLMLVNLLIAMLGNTYSNTIASARLQGRVKFARMVLQMELRAFNTPLGRLPGRQWRTNMVEKLGRLGVPRDGLYYLHFRSYSMPTGMTHRGTLGDIFRSEKEAVVDESGQHSIAHFSNLKHSFSGKKLKKISSFLGKIAGPEPPAELGGVEARLARIESKFATSELLQHEVRKLDFRLDDIEQTIGCRVEEAEHKTTAALEKLETLLKSFLPTRQPSVDGDMTT
ncbi:hypothetical protein AB1Y20_019576 [Prymnesium parvum]|uniref:Ion transport domain-containing protein n=1 Tax=Prymnesium parvum TaxID=97485 RepID=A0AB34JRF6_PRYPA